MRGARREKLQAGKQKLKKLGEQLIDVVDQIADLPSAPAQALDAKYNKDLKLAQDRLEKAEAKLSGDAPKDPAKTEPKTPPKADSKPEPKTEPKPETKPESKPKAKADPIEEIVKRLKDNIEKAVDKLAEKDTGKETVKLQEDIIKDLKDLKELLKQNSPNRRRGRWKRQFIQPGRRRCSPASRSGGSSGPKSNNPSQGGNSGAQKPKEDPNKNSGAGKKEEPKVGQAAIRQRTKRTREGRRLGRRQQQSGFDQPQRRPLQGRLGPSSQTKASGDGKPHQGRIHGRYVDMLNQYYRTIAEQGKKE